MFLTLVLVVKMLLRVLHSSVMGITIARSYRGFLRYGMKVPGVSFIVKKVFDLLLDHAAHLTPVQLESLRVKFGE